MAFLKALMHGFQSLFWAMHWAVRINDRVNNLIIQFSSVAQLCPTLWNPMNHSMPGLSAHHQIPESTQTHVHWVNDAIQPSHPLSSPSPPALNLSQHQIFPNELALCRWPKYSSLEIHTNRDFLGFLHAYCYFSHVRLFVTSWTVALKAPLSMGFSKQEYWSGLPCSPPGRSSQPRDWTHISCVSCIGRQVLYY